MDQLAGMETRISHPAKPEVTKGWVWVQTVFSEGLREGLKNMLWALLWMYLTCITNSELLYSTGNTAQHKVAAWMGGVCLWDKDTCICMTESLYCPPETSNTVSQLYSKTKLKVKKNWFGGRRRRTGILCRENKEQESEGKKQRVWGELGGTLVLFLKKRVAV